VAALEAASSPSIWDEINTDSRLIGYNKDILSLFGFTKDILQTRGHIFCDGIIQKVIIYKFKNFIGLIPVSNICRKGHHRHSEI